MERYTPSPESGAQSSGPANASESSENLDNNGALTELRKTSRVRDNVNSSLRQPDFLTSALPSREVASPYQQVGAAPGRAHSRTGAKVRESLTCVSQSVRKHLSNFSNSTQRFCMAVLAFLYAFSCYFYDSVLRGYHSIALWISSPQPARKRTRDRRFNSSLQTRFGEESSIASRISYSRDDSRQPASYQSQISVGRRHASSASSSRTPQLELSKNRPGLSLLCWQHKTQGKLFIVGGDFDHSRCRGWTGKHEQCSRRP